MRPIPGIEVNWQTAQTAAELIKRRPDYFGKGVERGTIDAFIAATAIVGRLLLVTLNRKHFGALKFPGFQRIILSEKDATWTV